MKNLLNIFPKYIANDPGRKFTIWYLWPLKWGFEICLNRYEDLSGTPIHNHKRDFISLIGAVGYIESIYTKGGNFAWDHEIKPYSTNRVSRLCFHKVHLIKSPTWTLQIYYGPKHEQEVIY